MRSVPILENQYYHIYNRGNAKQVLFHDKADYARFQFLILYMQSDVVLSQINRRISSFLKKNLYKVSNGDIEHILANRFVKLINFCIMPNHFHLTVQSVTSDGASRYMHKVSTAYAKYFNAKYDATGHVFQGTYKTKSIESDEQLHYLSTYIHANPAEIIRYKDRELSYPWSSYQDYKENRWGSLLCPELIMDAYKDFGEYQYCVETSGAKVSKA